MKPADLERLIKQKNSPVVVDVRSGFEFRAGHIPGALHAPSLKILFGLAKLPDDKTTQLVITCEHGPRAHMAQSLLALKGYRNTVLLSGHMSAWRRENRVVDR